MVVVPTDHLPHILHGRVLPGRVPDVLPAGDLLKRQQADFVAPVEEMAALGIVAGAHQVDPQPLEDVRVPSLHPRRHRAADVGVALVPVEPDQLAPLAVEVEAVRPELAKAHPKAGLNLVDQFAPPRRSSACAQ